MKAIEYTANKNNIYFSGTIGSYDNSSTRFSVYREWDKEDVLNELLQYIEEINTYGYSKLEPFHILDVLAIYLIFVFKI